MNLVSTAIGFVLLSIQLVAVTPYSFRAGTCGEGKSISKGHGTLGDSGSSLSTSQLVVDWESTALDPTQVTSIGSASEHTLTLRSTDGSSFKGFLIRLSGKGGEDTKSALQVKDSSLSQDLSFCPDDIVAITHKNANGKTSVSVGFSFDTPAELTLEVTVVTTAKINWVHDKFDISVVAPVATESPSVSPSLSMIPTLNQSPSPSSTPTVSTAPSVSPPPTGTPTHTSSPTIGSPPNSASGGSTFLGCFIATLLFTVLVPL